MLKIFASGVNTDSASQEIIEEAAKRHTSATFPMQRLMESKVQSPAGFANNTAFIQALLATLHDTAFVDISDFEIIERRQRWSRPLIALKKTIWSMLRFYTYRLWSQQNEINGFLLAALQGIHEDSNDRINALEKRVAELESQLPPK